MSFASCRGNGVEEPFYSKPLGPSPAGAMWSKIGQFETF